jgi:tRNA threonylcarbamoyladenosine biosynthesis protein TsaB
MDEVNSHAVGRADIRRILAFDCSGASCSAAVLSDGIILAHRSLAMERGQATALVPMIQAVMSDAAFTFDALDAVVTTVGPGSFTGIRLGLAAAHGIALAAGKPLLAVSSFSAHMAGLPRQEPASAVAVVIDSRRGPVFLQCFGALYGTASAPCQVEPGETADLLPPGHVMIVGDATPLLGSHLSPMAAIQTATHIDAAALARLAGGLLPWRPDFVAPVPLYLRPPDVTHPRPKAQSTP